MQDIEFIRKKQAQQAELGDGRDRKTRELDDIREFVASEQKYNEYEQNHAEGNSHKVKLYKKLYDLGLFGQCAHDVYDHLFDENLIRIFNEYINGNQAFLSLGEAKCKKLIPDLLRDFIISQQEESPLAGCKELTGQYRRLLEKKPLVGKQVTSNSKMNGYLNHAAEEHIKKYAEELLADPGLTPRQKVEKYKQRHDDIIARQPQMMEFYLSRKTKDGSMGLDVNPKEFEEFIEKGLERSRSANLFQKHFEQRDQGDNDFRYDFGWLLMK